MALNMAKLNGLNARVDFDALANLMSGVYNRIVGMEGATSAIITAALDTESETYEDDLVKAEELQNILSRSGLESVINDLMESLVAADAVISDIESLSGGGGPY